MRILDILKTALALALVAALCAACGTTTAPNTATDSPTTSAPTTAEAAPIDPLTEAQPDSPAAEEDLLDFALLDRLFAMTYGDFCREEGSTPEIQGPYDGAVYCNFSKYPDAVFFFDGDETSIPDTDLLNAVYFKAADLLANQQSVTLGELKQWLAGKGIECSAGYSEGNDGIRFFFQSGNYEIMGDLDSENDDAPIQFFEVYCKGNYAA